MDRRRLIATAAATFAASLIREANASKGGIEEHLTDPVYLKNHATRFIELDTGSMMDFLGQFMKTQKEYGGAAAHPERVAFLKANGYPLGPVDLSYEECHNILSQDRSYQAYIRLSRTVHEMMWDRALRSIYRHEDMYLTAMEATDKMGPGTLELNPSMHIPEYATYEIHEQPGGYCGNPFAGMLYHYCAVTAFYHGLADGPVNHDERNQIMVSGWPTPQDGKLKRILEVGCSHGSTTIALRERFDNPDIEVWALDVGAPQVRYAHHRAVKMGHKINWVHRLAEDTHFPDNYFDMIAINLIFHELPIFATRKIIPELQRITRPGGIWVGDGTGDGKYQGTIIQKAATWVNHRYNNETWEVQNLQNHFPTLRREAGWRTDNSTGQPIVIKT